MGRTGSGAGSVQIRSRRLQLDAQEDWQDPRWKVTMARNRAVTPRSRACRDQERDVLADMNHVSEVASSRHSVVPFSWIPAMPERGSVER